MTNKKNLILKFLKRKERASTSEIAIMIKSNFWVTKQYLEELENNGEVTREIFGRVTLWRSELK